VPEYAKEACGRPCSCDCWKTCTWSGTRGSGIRALREAMRRANLEPPRFDDKRSSFWVTFCNHTLMSPEAVTWLNQFAASPLNDRQRPVDTNGQGKRPPVFPCRHVDIPNSGQIFRIIRNIPGESAEKLRMAKPQ